MSSRFRQKLGIVRDNARVFGLVATVRAVIAHAIAPPPGDRFDQRYGVSTLEEVPVVDSDITGPNREHATAYQATHAQVLRDVLESLPVDHATTSFVDIGSGRGRALLMAAEYPYASVIGVELSPDHCRIAEENLSRYRGPRACTDVRVLCADACTFELPAGPTVFYLFNPFQRPVLERVLARIDASARTAPRPIHIAYCNPAAGTDLLEAHGFHMVRATRVIQPWWSWSLWKHA